MTIDNLILSLFFGCHLMKVLQTLKFQFRTPLVFLIHLLLWTLFFFVIETIIYRSINSLLESLLDVFPILIALGFITSYREARGRLNGIAKTQQAWMKWFNNQELRLPINENKVSTSLSKKLKLRSILVAVKGVLAEMFSNPRIFVFHFVCWISVSFLATLLGDTMQYNIREEWSVGLFQIIDDVVSEMKSEFIYSLFILAIFAFITGLQETKGELRGIDQENHQWLKWYGKYKESLHNHNTIEEFPSLITNETGLLFVKREPFFTAIYTIVVIVLFSILAVQLIQFTDLTGIKFLSYIALLFLFLR